MVQAPGQVSPDGKWLWNGAQWVANVQVVAQPQPVAWARPYESAGFRVRFVMVFLLANVAALLIGIAFDVVNIVYLAQGGAASDGLTVAVGVLALVVLITYYGTLLPSIALFCMWLHRVVRNMPALGAWDPRWSPAGAVGRCFIPILNLAHPMSGTLEAWRGSDPGRRSIDAAARKKLRPPTLIVGWWTLWLIGNWITFIATRMSFSNDTATQSAGAFIDIVGSILVMGAAVLAVLVVRDVTARQDRKSELIGTGRLS